MSVSFSPTASPDSFLFLSDVPVGFDRQFVHRPIQGGFPEQRQSSNPYVGDLSSVYPSGHRAGRDAEVLGGLPASHVVGRLSGWFHAKKFWHLCDEV